MRLDLAKKEHRNKIQRDYAKRSNYAASNKYNKEKTKQYSIRLIISKDGDILEKLSNQESVAGYIKELIRQDIEKNGLY